MQFQREKNEIRSELEKKIRENNLKSQLAQEETRALQDNVHSLKEKMIKKKEKSKELKRVGFSV